MRLTSFSDYALRVLIYAAAKGETLSTVEETAKVFNISRSHLKKVVMLLVRARFLKATRGRHGGFGLARPPADIVLGHVIRATEPDFGMVDCFLPGNTCLITRQCVLPTVINAATLAFLDVFDRSTLADVMIGPELFRLPAPDHQPMRGPIGIDVTVARDL